VNTDQGHSRLDGWIVAVREGSSQWALLLAIAVLIFGYVLSGWLGLRYAVLSAGSTAVWPPSGIALAMLILFGLRVWPGIFIGSILVNLTTHDPLGTGLTVATGNTLEIVVAAYLVHSFANGVRAFERPGDVLKFAFYAAVLSSMIGATFGATSLYLAGYSPWNEFETVWLTWWLGDAAGILIFAPMLVLLATPENVMWTARRQLDVAVAYVTTVLVSVLVFGGLTVASITHKPIQYIILPVLIWSAYRLGSRESAPALFLMACIAVLGTLQGFGPFAQSTVNESLLLLQGFVAVIIVSTLTLAAAIFSGRRAEEAIRASEVRLRLVEEQLRLREQRRADEAESARDQLREFMGMVVHDLRNPLTVTLGYLQMLRQQLQETESHRQLAIVDKIDPSLMTARRLIEDLLDSTRIGGGRFVIRPSPADFVDIVRQVVEAQITLDAGHFYVVDAPISLPGLCDTERIRQVLTNLMSNAAKFSPSGSVVQVTAERVGGIVRLSVTDQGPGLTPSQIDLLFQPFSRLIEGNEASGTGLGLYITKGIVEAHHGRVWVTSVIGEGSTFFVELPVEGDLPVIASQD
jgi:signal transduction histidine kinase